MNMRTGLIILGVIVVLLVGFFLATRVFNLSLPGNNGGERQTTTINDETFSLEIADTPEKKQKGLSNRRALGEKQGMLFPFDTPGMYSFWMKDMRFPIDMIFINNNKVVTIHRDIQPPENEDQELQIYSSDEPADKVLELAAGAAERYNINEGDTITIAL